jgi:hypothetical protein
MTDITRKLDEIEAGLEGVTPGPWEPFICDDGKQWSGWPLSIEAWSIADKSIVRPGGFYPYEWDAKTSQHEACANASHIARLDPDTVRELVRLARIGAETEARRAALDELVKLSQEMEL